MKIRKTKKKRKKMMMALKLKMLKMKIKKRRRRPKTFKKSIMKWNRLTKLSHFGPEVQIILNQKNKQNFIKV